jgi:hypothetical protein
LLEVIVERFHRKRVIYKRFLIPFQEMCTMTYVLVRLTVEDLAKWKPVFEEASGLRKNASSIGVRAFSKADSPNEVVILGEYADKENAMRQHVQA